VLISVQLFIYAHDDPTHNPNTDCNPRHSPNPIPHPNHKLQWGVNSTGNSEQ